jgi:hypothetical protein
MIPLQEPTNNDNYYIVMKSVRNFFLDYVWDEQTEAKTITTEIKTVLQNAKFYCGNSIEESDYESICYNARRFIHHNVAKQTLVAVHGVDGLHRWTGLECVLNGFGEDAEGIY